mgnify:CR=1 FL=1
MAHGLAGILLMILNYSEYFEDRPEAEKLVKDSVDYMLSLQKPNGKSFDYFLTSFQYMMTENP